MVDVLLKVFTFVSGSKNLLTKSATLFFFFLILFYFETLQYCISFAKYFYIQISNTNIYQRII